MDHDQYVLTVIAGEPIRKAPTFTEILTAMGWSHQKEHDDQRRTVYDKERHRVGSFSAYELAIFLRTVCKSCHAYPSERVTREGRERWLRNHMTRRHGARRLRFVGRLPVRDDVTEIECHRNPTPAEVRFGEGATHYRTFPVEAVCHPGTRFKKRWFRADDDGLRYFT